MENKKTVLTEKDLYCIAKHIQTEVVERGFKEKNNIEDSCTKCKYINECYKNGKGIAHWDTFLKLGEITGVKMCPGTIFSNET